MKRLLTILVAGLWSATIVWGADGINYDGNNLTLNNNFTRSQCGTAYKSVMKEVSGLAYSRQTPGYLWAHGDENTGDNKKIVAIRPDGTLVMTVTISDDPGRDDWEDIATGVYNNTNYVFLGAIGDNDLKYNNQYYIYYFAEPTIASGTVDASVSYIRFGYPDNQAHNTETLMYDNVEQMFYIADKVDGDVCHLYKLPFRTDYGTITQTLTEVCALGNGNKFNYLTGGDISPDGKWMAIKNKKYVLLWERQGLESLAATAQRRPTQIAAYQEEDQGESLAWADSTIFYTTSDSKKDTPIYKYVRNDSSTPDDPPTPPDTLPTPPQLYEVIMSNSYSAYVADNQLKAFYLEGEEVPTVASHKTNDGTTWEQNGNTITLVGTDSSTLTYTLDVQLVSPVAFTASEIVFDGTETWVKGAYGFDSSKKWRFSKTDDDYSREIAGRTHVEFFLPACDTVVLKSMDGNERDMRVYANGVQVGSKTKLLKSGTTLVVNQDAPFMLSVVSAQSSGDGGVKALRMARKETTAIDEIRSDAPCSKVVRDGQILILRGERVYTITGIEVK